MNEKAPDDKHNEANNGVTDSSAVPSGDKVGPQNKKTIEEANRAKQNQEKAIRPVSLGLLVSYLVRPIVVAWNWLGKTEVSNRIVAGATAIIAVWAFLQWLEMHGASGQTTQLITAANGIQCAAQQFSGSAGRIDSSVQNAVTKLNIQAQNMSGLVELEKRIAKTTYGAPNLVLSDWIGFFPPNKGRIKVTIRVQNAGITDAFGVRLAAKINFRTTPPHAADYPEESTLVEYQTLPRSIIDKTKEPSDMRRCTNCADFTRTKDFRETITNPSLKSEYLYVWGEVSYTDVIGDEMNTPFCRCYPANIFRLPPSGTSYYKECEYKIPN